MEFLKCDAPGCDHRELMEELTQAVVGKPCPKCGANLCTQEDFDHYVAFVRPAMKLMQDLGISEPATAETPASQRLSVNYHEGELRIGFPKPAAA